MPLLIAATCSFAAEIPCVATVVKDPGWEHYAVKIDLMDYSTKKLIAKLDLNAAKPAEKVASINTVSQSFNCKQHPMIYFTVQYTPVMWQENKGKIYQSSNIWDTYQQLQKIKPGTDKIEIKIHFPDDFQGVPELIEGIH